MHTEELFHIYYILFMEKYRNEFFPIVAFLNARS